MKVVPVGDKQLCSWNELYAVYPESFAEAIEMASKNRLAPEEKERIVNEVLDPETSGIDLVSLLQQVRDFGDPLGSTQEAAVRTCLRSCQDDIRDLKTQISDTISTISRLGRQLSETSCQLVKRSRHLCAIQILFTEDQRLPQDILEQIFLQTIRPEDELVDRRSKCASLQLGAVCHRWRVIIHSMPALWDTIHLRPSSQSSVELAKLWLSRSQYPSIVLYPWKGDNVAKVTSPAFAFLRGASKRFRRIHFTGQTGDNISEVFPLLVNAWSEKLEELDVRFATQLPEIRVPHLKRLFIAGGSPLWGLWPSSAPSTHLKQLTVLGITCSVEPLLLPFILSQLPSLHQLYISLHDDFPPEVSHINHPITHSNLRYLGICDMAREVIPDNLLDHISFPILNTMECHIDCRKDTPPPWLCSHPFLLQLRRFTLTHFAERTETTLLTLLPQLPRVEELCLMVHPDGLARILGVLASIPTRSSENPPLVPLLRRLKIGSDVAFSGLDKFTSEFQQLIRSWSPPTSNIISDLGHASPIHILTHLQIHYYGKMPDDFGSDNRNLNTPELCERLRGVSLGLIIQFTGEVIKDDYAATQHHPKSFGEAQRYYVMGDDGLWKLDPEFL
ncbi:hypothetical protein BDN72DRAFT_845186 [Pluteus cervinus]|uniref:Uncharacterized protein n=1 Tax=Pluteus cervinus TaxID=181527 RepID=A0ACD3AIY9_9AGAR|nr:hypothetical protein BDN72DRAFT_845186 [Pluteus cervinus]